MKISVKVKPNSRVEEVSKEADVFVVKTKESPHEGKANNAVIRLIAGYYKKPKSSVRIVRGVSSRNKVIEITD